MDVFVQCSENGLFDKLCLHFWVSLVDVGYMQVGQPTFVAVFLCMTFNLKWFYIVCDVALLPSVCL